MFGKRQHKIAIDHELYERLEKAAQVAGYSSVEEFVVHLLEGAGYPVYHSWMSLAPAEA